LQTFRSFGDRFGLCAQQFKHLKITGRVGHAATLIYEQRTNLQARSRALS
jgi:hypothetical protein